jgi:hypothetical protein
MFIVCVCVCVFLCLCISRGLATNWSPLPKSPTDCPWSRNWGNSALCSKSWSKLPSVGAARKKEKLNLFLCLTNSALYHEGVWGSGCPLGTAATSGLLYKPQKIDEGDCGEIGGMKIGRVNRSTRRKPAPAPLCPPQIPHNQTRARTRAAAVGSQRLNASAMARPEWMYRSTFSWPRAPSTH